LRGKSDSQYAFSKPTGWAENSLPTNVTLLKACEVDEVLSGDDEKYKAVVIADAGHNSKK
jgi:hypothetical protein